MKGLLKKVWKLKVVNTTVTILNRLSYFFLSRKVIGKGVIGSNVKISNCQLGLNYSLGKNSVLLDSELALDTFISYDCNINQSTLSGVIKIGEGCKINRAEIRGEVTIGRYTSLWGPNIDIYTNGSSKVTIGSFCSIARNVSFQTYNHNIARISSYFIGQNFFKESWENEIITKGDTIIGNDVWIGTHSVILGGLTIGHGAVIAANSVVTKDIPPYAIVGGVPAKVLKFRFSENIVEKLLELEWWNWSEEKLQKNKKLFVENLTLEMFPKIV